MSFINNLENEMSKEQFEILEPAFCVAMYEAEKMMQDGWEISKEREPIDLGPLFSIMMERKEAPAVEADVKKAGRPAKVK